MVVFADTLVAHIFVNKSVCGNCVCEHQVIIMWYQSREKLYLQCWSPLHSYQPAFLADSHAVWYHTSKLRIACEDLQVDVFGFKDLFSKHCKFGNLKIQQNDIQWTEWVAIRLNSAQLDSGSLKTECYHVTTAYPSLPAATACKTRGGRRPSNGTRSIV